MPNPVHAFVTARSFDLQKSEAMLRKVSGYHQPHILPVLLLLTHHPLLSQVLVCLTQLLANNRCFIPEGQSAFPSLKTLRFPTSGLAKNDILAEIS